MKSFKLVLLLITTALSLTVFAEDVPQYLTLKDRRPDLKFPVYSVAQKKLVLNQVRMLLTEIFVHRELKIKDFGATADPVPALLEIEKKIETISDYDFHKQMAEIFINLRDFHTSYGMPRPYACYRSVIPVSFKEVKNLEGFNVIAVSAITEKPEILKFMPENFQIEKGDILLQYNGIPVRQAMRVAAARSRGANPAAVLNHSIQLLTYVGQNGDVAPAADEVVLTLKNRQGKVYKNTIPWVSSANIDCLKNTAPDEAIASGRKEMGANEYQNEFNKIFRKHRDAKSSVDGDGLKDTLEPILKYKKLNNEYGTFGYFQLESFVPEKLSIDGVVLEFKKLLQTEFINTTGIIIDLRDNGGGMISLAEKLSQLFTPKYITPLNFRQRSSPANLFYMQTIAPGSSFTKALEAAANTGAVNTTELPMNSFKGVNGLGQYFFRPVVILTNSSCYSSCDMFSAQMQDHGAAVIFGEDNNTGAGGANNYDLRALFGELPEGNKGPFALLPKNQNIGFSFRQTVRVGLHKGEALEDVGVVADKLAMPAISDLYNFSENQFKVLTGFMNKEAVKYKSWVTMAGDGNLEVPQRQTPSVFIKWAKTDTIEFRVEGKVIDTVKVEDDNIAGRKLEAPQSISTEEFKKDSYEIAGYFENKRVWKKVVTFRVVPEEITTIQSTGLSFDMSSGLPSFVHVYNDGNESAEGWQAVNGVMKTGNSDKYSDGVHSEAAAFFTLPSSQLTLKFDARIKTEKDYDFFKVIIISDGKETLVVPSISGDVALKNYSFDLGAFAGKKIELRFVFDSDEGTVDEGVFINNISIQ